MGGWVGGGGGGELLVLVTKQRVLQYRLWTRGLVWKFLCLIHKLSFIYSFIHFFLFLTRDKVHALETNKWRYKYKVYILVHQLLQASHEREEGAVCWDYSSCSLLQNLARRQLVHNRIC